MFQTLQPLSLAVTTVTFAGSFVLYTGHTEVDHECSAAAIIEKAAPSAEVVARVECLLT